MKAIQTIFLAALTLVSTSTFAKKHSTCEINVRGISNKAKVNLKKKGFKIVNGNADITLEVNVDNNANGPLGRYQLGNFQCAYELVITDSEGVFDKVITDSTFKIAGDYLRTCADWRDGDIESALKWRVRSCETR
tara:strand:+ start:672 stop:1076 length:405 start_codon:yes stop_codon:yes gene_type:complete